MLYINITNNDQLALQVECKENKRERYMFKRKTRERERERERELLCIYLHSISRILTILHLLGEHLEE